MKHRWAPAVVLGVGAALTLGVAKQRSVPLARSLAEVVPLEIHGYRGQDQFIAENEAQVAGFSNYLFRIYELAQDTLATQLANAEAPLPRGTDPATVPSWFSVYVGYYESQTQGNTIHSPKNCLPGAGWEALSSREETIPLDGRTVTVNRYLLQNEGQRALVLYWYQGRGRIAHDEYLVKVNLLLDAALKRRSDEALVRIVVPVGAGGEDAAMATAVRVAQVVAPSLDLALPGV